MRGKLFKFKTGYVIKRLMSTLHGYLLLIRRNPSLIIIERPSTISRDVPGTVKNGPLIIVAPLLLTSQVPSNAFIVVFFN